MDVHTFTAFRSRNYKLYFFGQSVSLVGTWMQRTAVYWLIYLQTHSTFMLGLAVFAAQFPSFLLSPLGGVISDRHDRYRVMLITQAASMVQAAVLTALVLSGHYALWHIFALSAVLGAINAFDVPARQSMVHQMVDEPAHLPNAIALNSSMVNLAWLIGPAVSGIILEKLGAGACFLINTLSFVAVLASLSQMRLPAYVPQTRVKRIAGEFREGWRYLRTTPAIGRVILMLACVSLLVLPYSTLLPVYAKVIFAGNAATFGYLNSCVGLGAVGGALFLASLKGGARLKKILLINLLLFGAGLILFSHMTNLPLALLCSALTGFGMMSQTTISNTLIQTTVSVAMRGRIIGFFAMSVFGMRPIGGLLIGTVSKWIGAPDTILAEGLAAILIALCFFPYLREEVLAEKDKMRMVELETPSADANQ
jgi:MFS family permease